LHRRQANVNLAKIFSLKTQKNPKTGSSVGSRMAA